MNAMADTAMSVQTHWTRLRPLIQKAIPFMGGTHDESDLIKCVMGGTMTLWPGKNAFCLACIERHPKLTLVSLLLAGGDKEECVRLQDSVIAWGKAMGATELKTEARPGLDRTYQRSGRDLGLKRQRVVYTRTI